jgi:Bacterial Ig domain
MNRRLDKVPGFASTFALISSLLFSIPLLAADFYVAPRVSPGGNGSISSPWDLQTALNQPSAVHPGDTIWLRAGIHRLANRPTKFVSQLAGAPDQPITVRQYPGEHATVDGNIMQASGGWVNFWGFEIMDSQQFGSTNFPTRVTTEVGPFPTTWYATYDGKTIDFTVSGFDVRAPNCKLINLIVHDNIGGGFGINVEAGNTEVYGCLSYFNGWQGPDRAHGHGLYGQNVDPAQKKVLDCLIFNNYALGMQATGAGPTPIADNFWIEGNAFFLNGALSLNHQANLLVGPFQGIAKNPVIRTNFIYDKDGTGADFDIGNSAGALVQGNYFQTSATFATNINLTMEGNSFLAGVIGIDPCTYPNNNYLLNTPTTNMVTVRPNSYEPGRAHIIIYNWENLNSVAVNVAGILSVGAAFELRNAQDFYGPPVLAGTYQGVPLNIPLIGLSVAQPVGVAGPISSAPAFAAFVLLPVNGTNVAVPKSSKPRLSEKVYIPIEARAGEITPPMRLATDAKVSTRRFVASRTAEKGTATFVINVPVPNTYVIWANVLTRSRDNDSFFVSMDGEPEDIHEAREGTWSPAWQWVLINGREGRKVSSYDSRRFVLSKGAHSLKFRTHEQNVALSRILVTDDLSFVPKDVVAVAQSLAAVAGATTQFTQDLFLCNATNLFGDGLTLSIPAPYTSQNGIVTCLGKEILYTPRLGFVGNDRFTYLLTSTQGDTATGTAVVSVRPSSKTGNRSVP